MMVMPIILLLYTSLQRESWIWRNFPIFCAVCIWSHNSMSWFLVFKTFLFRDQRNNFVQVIDNLIETGHGEQIFQRAIQEQGRGHVCTLFCFYSLWGLWGMLFATVMWQKVHELLVVWFVALWWVGQVLDLFWGPHKIVEAYCRFWATQILDIIAEIQERHDAVRDIEKKLLDLHQVALLFSVVLFLFLEH